MHAKLMIVLVAGWSAVTSNSVAGGRTEVYRDEYVIAEVETPSILKGNLHGDEIFYLKAFGRTYKWVQGSKPFYIDIPKLAAIAFVTQDLRDRCTLHVVNIESKKETEVKLVDFTFGSFIGYEHFGRKRGDPGTDFIDVSGERLLLTMRSWRWKSRAVVNLTSKSIERTETEMYDGDGHVTERWV